MLSCSKASPFAELFAPGGSAGLVTCAVYSALVALTGQLLTVPGQSAVRLRRCAISTDSIKGLPPLGKLTTTECEWPTWYSYSQSAKPRYPQTVERPTVEGRPEGGAIPRGYS